MWALHEGWSRGLVGRRSLVAGVATPFTPEVPFGPISWAAVQATDSFATDAVDSALMVVATLEPTIHAWAYLDPDRARRRGCRGCDAGRLALGPRCRCQGHL